MTILFLCTANVCRSPIAEGYLKHLLSESGPALKVHSAGIYALTGSPAFECSVQVAKLNGFDITDHLARQLIPSMVQEADRILCMETWQAAQVVEMDSHQAQKVALLGKYYPGGNPLFQISDPLRFQVPEMLRTFQLIKDSIDAFFMTLKTGS